MSNLVETNIYVEQEGSEFVAYGSATVAPSHGVVGVYLHRAGRTPMRALNALMSACMLSGSEEREEDVFFPILSQPRHLRDLMRGTLMSDVASRIRAQKI